MPSSVRASDSSRASALSDIGLPAVVASSGPSAGTPAASRSSRCSATYAAAFGSMDTGRPPTVTAVPSAAVSARVTAQIAVEPSRAAASAHAAPRTGNR